MPWRFEITRRAAAKANDWGTSVTITELHDEVTRRMDDGLFGAQLVDAISRTYSFFIGRVVEIFVNDRQVEADPLEIGQNFGLASFADRGVSCNVTAGIAATRGENYRDRNA